MQIYRETIVQVRAILGAPVGVDIVEHARAVAWERAALRARVHELKRLGAWMRPARPASRPGPLDGAAAVAEVTGGRRG